MQRKKEKAGLQGRDKISLSFFPVFIPSPFVSAYPGFLKVR